MRMRTAIIIFYLLRFTTNILAQEISDKNTITRYSSKYAPPFYFENINANSELSFIDSRKYFGANTSSEYFLTLLVFFRGDCKMCLKMIEPLKLLNQKYKNKKVFILLVSIDDQDKQKDVIQLLEKNKIWIPVAFDSYTNNFTAKKYLGSDLLLPNLFLIDKSGKILFEFDSYNGLFDRISVLIDGHIQLEVQH